MPRKKLTISLFTPEPASGPCVIATDVSQVLSSVGVSIPLELKTQIQDSLTRLCQLSEAYRRAGLIEETLNRISRIQNCAEVLQREICGPSVADSDQGEDACREANHLINRQAYAWHSDFNPNADQQEVVEGIRRERIKQYEDRMVAAFHVAEGIEERGTPTHTTLLMRTGSLLSESTAACINARAELAKDKLKLGVERDDPWNIWLGGVTKLIEVDHQISLTREQRFLLIKALNGCLPKQIRRQLQSAEALSKAKSRAWEKHFPDIARSGTQN